jgi:hypothetical protein
MSFQCLLFVLKREGSRSENVKFVSRFIPMVIKYLQKGGGGSAGTRNPGGCGASGGWGFGWVMTWMAGRPENGTEIKILYDKGV